MLDIKEVLKPSPRSRRKSHNLTKIKPLSKLSRNVSSGAEGESILYNLILESKNHAKAIRVDNLIKRLKGRVRQMDVEERIKDMNFGVLDINNEVLAKFSTITNHREKMKGRFALRMSPYLTSPQKIEKYAQEPSAFYLHKNCRFFK